MVSDDRVICVVANCKALSPADWESCWEKNTQDFAIHFVVYQIYKSCKNYDLFNLALRVLTRLTPSSVKSWFDTPVSCGNPNVRPLNAF